MEELGVLSFLIAFIDISALAILWGRHISLEDKKKESLKIDVIVIVATIIIEVFIVIMFYAIHYLIE